ncbi:MAG: hypothetical protein WCQ53_04635 [bacterium]
MKMSYLILLGFFCLGLQACNEFKSREATLKICPEHIVGCADRLEVSKISYLIDPINDAAKSSFSKMTANRKKKEFSEIKVTIDGCAVKEKGHFPNPMAEFDVIKLKSIR